MDLIARLRGLSEEMVERRTTLPLRPSSSAYPLAWLDLDAPDVWDGYPELDDVEDELVAYLPLADVTIHEDEHRCLVVARQPPHAVSVFDEGFLQIAPSLDVFVQGLLGPGETPLPAASASASASPSPVQLAAQLQAAADVAIAAGRWAEARQLVEEALSRWKPPEALNELRARLARVLAELCDRAAGAELAAAHHDYLVWLASDEHDRAVALQARFAEVLGEMRIGAAGDAEILVTVRAVVCAELAAPAPPPTAASEREIDLALRLVRSGKAPGLRSLLARVPALLDVPAMLAALAELDTSPRAAEVRQVVAEARAATRPT